MAEGIVLAGRYVKQHTYEKMYEREVFWTDEEAAINGGAESEVRDSQTELGDFYGIGIGADDGSLFWFHKKTEEVTDSP